MLVALMFGLSFYIDYMGFKLFHPIVHGVALSGIALIGIFIMERNRSFENNLRGEIPAEFLPG